MCQITFVPSVEVCVKFVIYIVRCMAMLNACSRKTLECCDNIKFTVCILFVCVILFFLYTQSKILENLQINWYN